MNGKICLVTGATSGIGQATALALVRRGATVIVGGRSRARGEATLDRIRREVGHGASVELALADLSSQDGVRALAREVTGRHARLDVLVNNAGGVFLRPRRSADGIGMSLALNHLGSFLLTHLLLDTLRASAPARIVNVASVAHEGQRIDLDRLEARRSFRGGMSAYGQSKLANILFTYELARRLAGSGVTANCLHPGFVSTRLASHDGPLIALAARLFMLSGMSPAQGARTVVYLAASPHVEGVSGQYFVRSRPARSSPASYDEAAARRLWAISERLTGLA